MFKFLKRAILFFIVLCILIVMFAPKYSEEEKIARDQKYALTKFADHTDRELKLRAEYLKDQLTEQQFQFFRAKHQAETAQFQDRDSDYKAFNDRSNTLIFRIEESKKEIASIDYCLKVRAENQAQKPAAGGKNGRTR